MATAKKKSKKAGKPAPKHLMPEGFWRQIGAIVLIVLAILLIVAFFNVAGPVPAGILNFLQMTIGWTTYVLPVVLAYIGIQIFRADKNRLPSIMVIATIVFVILSSGFLGLFAPDSLQMTQSQGGFVGYTVDAATLAFLSNPIGKLLLGVLIVIDILFVLRVTPAAIIRWFKETFASEQTTNDMNVAVAKKAAAISAAKTDEGLGDMKIKNGLETPDA
jgi:hypothetical protein